MKPIDEALEELEKAEAQDLPTPWEIEQADVGASWSGKKPDGSDWTLTKGATDSFTCEC